MSVTAPRQTLYPLKYPRALEFWKLQHSVHWLPDESPLGQDVIDYWDKLTEQERNLITQIFRLFTKSDEEINNCYHDTYRKIFQAPEIKIMLGGFSEFETIHVLSYSHLLITLGLPDSEFSAFTQYEEMQAKMDWIGKFDPKSPIEVAEAMAAFSLAVEGMSLFASFAILLNFDRRGLMKGMADIIRYSIRDESLHCEGIAWLFTEYVKENYHLIDHHELRQRVYKVMTEAVANEDAFLDLAFEMGDIEGLTKAGMKKYIRYIADFRLAQVGYAPLFGIDEHPQPWLIEQMNGVEHGNFFERRVSEYSKGATTGDWDDAFNF